LIFDVFAGVGPFAVPASMLGCTVFANDLNPEAVKWLEFNMKNNQKRHSTHPYRIYNMDARAFLEQVVLPNIDTYQNETLADRDLQWCRSQSKLVILMNLPELAWTFLNTFDRRLFKEGWPVPIHVHCYIFSKADDPHAEVRQRVQSVWPSLDNQQIQTRFVRQVAPSKSMLCATICLS
jgi:tRNA (guanine37-N1)-methyltransferase